MIFVSYTHRGRVRESNEDSVFIPVGGKAWPAQTPAFMAVADGMGGHNAGEVASAMAIRSMVNLFEEPDGQAQASAAPATFLQEAVNATNVKVYYLSRQSEQLAGMGTTLTCALCFTQQLFIAHIGDSRAYLIKPDGTILRITRDHTLVQEYVDNGVLTKEQAETSAQRNILTRALGTGLSQTADVFEQRWEQGESLLLCSDGLSNHVSEREIGLMIAEATSPGEAAQALGALALQRGGMDNITLCIAHNAGGECT